MTYYAITRVLTERGRVTAATVREMTQMPIGRHIAGLGAETHLSAPDVANLIATGDEVYASTQNAETGKFEISEQVRAYGNEQFLETFDEDGKGTEALGRLPKME